MTSVPTADLYLRLSDLRTEESLDGREAKLRALAVGLGWTVHRVVIENDMVPGKDGQMRPVTAFKRRKIVTPSGRKELRVIRQGFREVLEDLETGRANALAAEDLDRVFRDPRDLEDFIDVAQERKVSARSLSGSLIFTGGGTDSEIDMARMLVTMANKASRDTSRRVREKKEFLHGKSWCGGPRPYGYVPAQETEKYHRTLVIVPDEAEVIQKAAHEILELDIPLSAVVRDLRERGVPTVNGGKWHPRGLKLVLTKPTIAGLAARKGELKPAPWPAILERDTWDALCAKLQDPARKPDGYTGNEPRWLLSWIAECGFCHDGSTVVVTGSHRRNGPKYVCRNCLRINRNAVNSDRFIEEVIIRRLAAQAGDILKPPVRKDIDTAGLRAEAKKLRDRKAAQMSLHAAGEIDDEDLKRGMRAIRDRLAVVEAQLAACSETDKLAEFRDKPAGAVWKSLPLARRRAVVRLLADVTFLPNPRRGAGFDPDSVLVRWKAGAAPQAAASAQG